MKINSQQTGTGKLGNTIYSVNSGVCITRNYRDSITNPNTEAQVGQRARFKLMSQVAASMAPVIAIPKKKLVSSRNLFVKKNFDQSYVSGEEAGVFLQNLQLTGGSAGFAGVNAARNAGTNKIDLTLAHNVESAVTRVVYNAFSISSEGNLQLVGSVIATEAGENGNFPASIPATAGDVVVYAYGMKDLSKAASAKYGNYHVNSGEDVAQLILSRKISASDFQLTETTGNILGASDNATVVVPDGSVKIEVIAGNGTQVQESGQGSPASRVTLVKVAGTSVTLDVTAESGYQFDGWYDANTGVKLSDADPYTFTANESMTIRSHAQYNGGGMD